MSDVLLDTNILIDALNRVPAAKTELQRNRSAWISRISWIEVMAGAPEPARAETEEFLGSFRISELTEEVARRAAAIRSQDKRLKLPDAIIWATAQAAGRTLVTRNTRDFPSNIPGIHIPYQL